VEVAPVELAVNRILGPMAKNPEPELTAWSVSTPTTVDEADR